MATWNELGRYLKAIREAAQKQIAQALSRVTRRYEEPVIPPPVQPFRPSRRDEDEQFDDIELDGRDASYDDRAWQRAQANEVIVVSSSNVYSYYFEQENPSSGILFVTFLNWEPGMPSKDRSGPGATYAYYGVPTRKYQEFVSAANESAGKAVWDYCRVRGTLHDHQHQYRLIQVAGDYVPRKATARGFAERTLVAPGMSAGNRRKTFRRSQSRENHPAGQFFKRSTLAPTRGAGRINRGTPNRGTPNRGEPNRGEPNRGN